MMLGTNSGAIDSPPIMATPWGKAAPRPVLPVVR